MDHMMIKWISTALVLTGILLTNLNIYPLNIYFHGVGVIGWTIAGFFSEIKQFLSILVCKSHYLRLVFLKQ